MRTGKLFAALLLCASGFTAAQADNMRCGQRLVVDGTTRDQVATWCGEPTEVLQRTVLRPPIVWYYGRPVHVGGGHIEVLVETWIYNLGPNKLMRRVIFEDGLVVEVETLGYGYRGSPPAREN
ncbi:MAG TPA: DUF2845 domain-containing protein [Steroidobacteraceae bacterium]|nr:DUF2845 domain-containing protein [Steroidobacteraceae bacterium]HNS27313.1 DUF2845 domain-containing protein [Steroidobacteraceae bacterium]